MTVQQRTIKSFGIAMFGFVVAMTAQVLAPVSAQAQVALPEAPQITLTAATCEAKYNKLNLVMPKGDTKKYRFVLVVDGKNERQLNSAIRKTLYAKNEHILEESLLVGLSQVYYGKKVGLQAYYFAGKNELKDLQQTVQLEVGDDLTRAIKLGDLQEVTLTDPKTLNCAPTVAPTPKLSKEKLPVAPVFSLHPATCDERKNAMTFDDKSLTNVRYRFVISLEDGKKIQLKTDLRNKLFADGRLLLEDVIAEEYPAMIGKIPYGATITVQAYYFDDDEEYDEALYDTNLKLTVGKSDRFIKLGEAKSAVLAKPTCDQPTNPVDPVTPADPGQGTQPTPPVDNGGATTQPTNPVDQAAAPIPAPVAPIKPARPRTTKLADTGVDQQAIIAVAFVMLTLGAVMLARRLA